MARKEVDVEHGNCTSLFGRFNVVPPMVGFNKSKHMASDLFGVSTHLRPTPLKLGGEMFIVDVPRT